MGQINNLRDYKRCKKLSYDIWLCLPPKGTLVFNKLEDLGNLPNEIEELSQRLFLTREELLQYPNDIQFRAKIAGYTIGDLFDIAAYGVCGQLYATTYAEVSRYYQVFVGGKSVSFSEALLKLGKTINGESCLDWVKARYTPSDTDYWACFIPESERATLVTLYNATTEINTPGVPHGKGDFVVCPDRNGSPDFNSRAVINGLVFAKTFSSKYFDSELVIENSDLPFAPLMFDDSFKSGRFSPGFVQQIVIFLNDLGIQVLDKEYSPVHVKLNLGKEGVLTFTASKAEIWQGSKRIFNQDMDILWSDKVYIGSFKNKYIESRGV